MESFYKLFGLKAGDNGVEGLKKDVYTRHIVYGSVGNFQHDWLRDVHYNCGIRGGRSFDMAIVDEVDSMLVDSGDNIAKLASSIPAMEYLEQIMSHIWYHLHETETHYFNHDGRLFYIGTKSNKIEENIDINLLLQDAETNRVVEVENKLEFTRKTLEGNINSWIEGEGGHKAAIPGHLQSFVKY